MHDAIAAMLARSRERVALSTLVARPGSSVVLAFGRSRPFPIWAAKIASTNESARLLQREYAALETLRPWAERLNIPVTLAWHEAAPSCLVTSGISGQVYRITLPVETGRRIDGRRLRAAVQWLRLLQATVPVDAVERLSRGSGDDEVEELEREADRSRDLPELHDLCDMLRRAGDARPHMPSHGDYWAGNILFAAGRHGERPGVIDLEGFRARDRFHDLFSLFTACDYFVDRKIHNRVSAARFFQLFFTEGAAARFIRASIAELRPAEPELRRAFYLFIGNSVRIKGPTFRASWAQIVRDLARRGFPAPWSRILPQS
jgi:aminoglycoside phosphotransferase (APT) family kinase protein